MDMNTMNNLRTVTLKMRRRDVIDLLVACDACGEMALSGGGDSQKNGNICMLYSNSNLLLLMKSWRGEALKR